VSIAPQNFQPFSNRHGITRGLRSNVRKVPKAETPKEVLRVLIADGSSSAGEGLQSMLTDEENIQVIGCANKSIQALVMIESEQPDVVLLDLRLPSDKLTHLLHLIKGALPAPAVIVMAPYPSQVVRERCLRAGADHVLTKSADCDRIISILHELRIAKQGSLKRQNL
jgi:DNA-binding NarL/FixJ family response regulator